MVLEYSKLDIKTPNHAECQGCMPNGEGSSDVRAQTNRGLLLYGDPSACISCKSATGTKPSKREKLQQRHEQQRATAREALAQEERAHLLESHPRIATASNNPLGSTLEGQNDEILLATPAGEYVHAEVIDPKSLDENTQRQMTLRRPVSKRRQRLTVHLSDFHEMLCNDGQEVYVRSQQDLAMMIQAQVREEASTETVSRLHWALRSMCNVTSYWIILCCIILYCIIFPNTGRL